MWDLVGNPEDRFSYDAAKMASVAEMAGLCLPVILLKLEDGVSCEEPQIMLPR